MAKARQSYESSQRTGKQEAENGCYPEPAGQAHAQQWSHEFATKLAGSVIAVAQREAKATAQAEQGRDGGASSDGGCAPAPAIRACAQERRLLHQIRTSEWAACGARQAAEASRGGGGGGRCVGGERGRGEGPAEAQRGNLQLCDGQ